MTDFRSHKNDSSPKPAVTLSKWSHDLLQTLQLEFNRYQAADMIWTELLTEENRQTLGGDLSAALRRHQSTIGMVSFVWRSGPGETLVRLAGELGTMPPAWLLRFRRELGVRDLQAPARSSAVRPVWNKVLGELHYGGQLARRLASTTRAKAVVRILDLFEAAGWPTRIAGPSDCDDQRLRETVSSLNEKLQYLRFNMDGTGQGVLWRPEAALPQITSSGLDTGAAT
jgi:hypothetical protein